MRVLAAYVFVVCAALAGCATPPPNPQTEAQRCSADPVIDLPISITKTGVMAAVTINNATGQFLIDTGAERTTISRGFYSRTGLDSAMKKITVNGFGGTTQANTITLPDLRIGALDKGFVEAVVQERLLYDGVIGLDVLADYDAEFDLGHGRLTLHSQPLCPDHRPAWGSEMDEIRASKRMNFVPGTAFRSLNLFYLTAQLDGQPIQALLDSGNNTGFVVNPTVTDKLGITQAQLAQGKVVMARGVNDETNHVWQFGELRVGHEIYRNPRLLVASTHALPFEFNLGLPYFLRHRIWLNFSGNRAFVLRNAP